MDEDTPVNFSADPSTDNVGITNYTWTVADAVYYGTKIAHRFADPGTYLVVLNVSDAAGNEASASIEVTVLDTTPPTALIVGDRVVDEDTLVNFSADPSTDNVGIRNYTWMVADAVYYGTKIAHRFAAPGLSIVVLNISDAAGNEASASIEVTVLDTTPPTANAGEDLILDEGSMVTLDALGSADNVAIRNYTWIFDDATRYYGAVLNHTFSTPGEVTIVLEVRDAAGNTAEDALNVTVVDRTPPIVTFHANRTEPSAGTPVGFDARASSDNVAIVNYSWEMGDGSTSYGATVEHVYTAAGSYAVTLHVSDRAGNRDDATINISVTAAPTSDGDTDDTDETGADDDTGALGSLGIALILTIVALVAFFGLLFWTARQRSGPSVPDDFEGEGAHSLDGTGAASEGFEVEGMEGVEEEANAFIGEEAGADQLLQTLEE